MFDKDCNCPMQCGEVETKMHYIWCKDKEVTNKRKRVMTIFQKQLQAMNTCPGITLCLMRILIYGYEEQWRTQIRDTTEINDLIYYA